MSQGNFLVQFTATLYSVQYAKSKREREALNRIKHPCACTEVRILFYLTVTFDTANLPTHRYHCLHLVQMTTCRLLVWGALLPCLIFLLSSISITPGLIFTLLSISICLDVLRTHYASQNPACVLKNLIPWHLVDTFSNLGFLNCFWPWLLF